MSLLPFFAAAIERGDVAQIDAFISNNSIDINAHLPCVDNPPALVLAARLGRTDIADRLLSAGAQIDGTDDCGTTACHAAAMSDHSEMLARLLKHGPNLALKDASGFTPLESAFQVPADECTLMLIEAGAPLVDECRHDLCHFVATSAAAVRALQQRGFNLSELRDDQQRTPLHVVAAISDADKSTTEMANMLLDAGVDLEARDSRGFTCTHNAADYFNHVMLRFFASVGADVNAVDQAGRSPVHVVLGHNATVVLLAAGADVHAQDSMGRTPCHRVMMRDSSILLAMLAAGADLDVTDVRGITARQLLTNREHQLADEGNFESARRDIAKARLDFVRHRALQVCVGLQSRGLDALQMCEILLHSCGPVAPLVAFHHWWKIATIVKHFHSRQTMNA